MKLSLCAAAALMGCASLHAAVTLKTLTSDLQSPQTLGTVVTFTATASNAGSPDIVGFRFSVSFNNGPFVTISNYDIGIHSSSGWTSQPFKWTQIQTEGSYTIQVAAKDFHNGSVATLSVPFTLTSAV